MKFKVVFNTLFIGFFMKGIAISQTIPLDSLRKKYPDEKSIVLNKILTYSITLKEGLPHVERHELKQVEFLSDNSAAYSAPFTFYHSDFHQLKSYEAFCLLPDKSKIKVNSFKTKSDMESFVFYDDVKETSFNFPSIEPGAVGNLNVSWVDQDPHLLSPFYFEENEPVLNSELRISVSNSIQLKYSLYGLDTNKIEVKVENKRNENVYTFRYKNCPTSHFYSDAPGFSYYSPHVIFYILSYKDNQGFSFPYLSNLKDLYTLQYLYLKKVNTESNPILVHIVDSITRNQNTLENKARAIYSWVQSNIKYVAFENGMEGFIPRNAGLVCSRRFGDCKDMASILTEMMKMVGIPAYFTWIGTRSLPYTFTQFPLPLVSNHMICTIKLNNQYVFLDGTDPNAVFDTPPYSIQDKEAMLAINEQEYKILKVPIIEKSKNVVNDTTYLEIGSEGLVGVIHRILSGYFATRFLDDQMYKDKKEDLLNMQSVLQRGSNRFKLEKVALENHKESNSVFITGQFSLIGFLKKIGDEYFINLDLFKIYEHDEIDYPKRKIPIEYNFTSIRKYITVLTIPKGYKIGYQPSDLNYSNKAWGFKWSYTQKADKIILSQEFYNDHLFINPDLFLSWNQVLKKLFPLYKESLSLSNN